MTFDQSKWFQWARRFSRGDWIITGYSADRVRVPFDPDQFKPANDR